MNYIAFLIIGTAILIPLFGLGVFLSGSHRQTKKRKEEIAWLKQNGTILTATISNVREDTHIRVNGRAPFVVVCTWLDPAKQQEWTFTSDYIWNNPLYKIGTQKNVEVFVDPKDYRRSYVHVEALGVEV